MVHTAGATRRLAEKADAIRKDVVAVAVRNGAGHIAPSLSCIDILVALYYDVMTYDARDPRRGDRDRLIFSKGHGGYGLYAVLADLGMLPRREWERFYTPESSLCGCVERRVEYGIEASGGSLGHGLPLATGVAFGAKLQRTPYHVFCIAGDGELQEGTTWEALQFAVKHALGNLTLIVDHNGLQAMDFVTNVLDRAPDDLAARFRGFGLAPEMCAGHDTAALARVLRASKTGPRDMPSVVIAHTVKGYGLKCMENIPRFHFRLPTPEELAQGWVPCTTSAK